MRPRTRTPSACPSPRPPPAASGWRPCWPSALELYHNGHLPLLKLIERLTFAPAKLLGLQAGRLKAGAAADLVLFDPDKPWKVDPQAFHSKSKNTPFDARPVQGKVLRTIVDGRTVFVHD